MERDRNIIRTQTITKIKATLFLKKFVDKKEKARYLELIRSNSCIKKLINRDIIQQLELITKNEDLLEKKRKIRSARYFNQLLNKEK